MLHLLLDAGPSRLSDASRLLLGVRVGGCHMSYSLNSLKRLGGGIYRVPNIGVANGKTMSSAYSSHGFLFQTF